MKKIVIYTILGLLIGAGLTVTFYSVRKTTGTKVNADGWNKLNLVLDYLDKNYVDSIDHRKVTDAAIKAVLGALDPHTIYMEPQNLKESEDDLAGQFEGIGIQFNVPNDTAIVLEVIPGGPSEKIGMLAGDRLIKVNEKVIAGVKFPQDSMVRRMRGPAGTKVTVTVKRDKEMIPFEITRGKIPTYSVDAAFMVNDTTGYLRLSKFARTTHKEIVTAGAELYGEGMKHLIFDVRGNSGGYFDQALMISDLFLPKDSTIVYMEGLHRKRENYVATGNGLFRDIGLTVLISEDSASSSEIFAGAMQDNHRATIVGRRSFGKGLVQEPRDFSDGSGIRVTVARFFTPGGRCIQKAYSDDYAVEIFERYGTGEMVEADSMKVEKGGIIPDVFVPVDTTKAGSFYISCNKKATAMRFASAFFDSHKGELGAIEGYDELLAYLDRAGLEKAFLDFAVTRDNLKPSEEEWVLEKPYMMTQVRALVGRYSKLGDKAFYHIYLQIDETYKKAMDLLNE